MTPVDVLELAIRPALRLLPERMSSPAAVALLLAIGLQETRFKHRRQVPKGPALGLWQFERGGVRACSGHFCWGVLVHPATRPHAEAVLRRLLYPIDAAAVHAAIQHNDVLAAVFARLLLFTLPQALPGPRDVEAAWQQYLAAWRPGKPHRRTWAGFYATGWELVS